MKAIVILMDSLNRRFLSTYGNEWVKTPNIERIAEKSTVFDNHWTGSAPCMPARRDMLTGRLNFLERNWGPIEPFDCTLPEVLRKRGIRSHIVTDHYLYFITGGENYCQSFDTWENFRGQEVDPWVSRFDNEDINVPEYYGKYEVQYYLNRSGYKSDGDFSTPKTFQQAAQWLERNKNADNYLLWVEAYDPHEPFDVTEEFLDLYGDDYKGKEYFWPEYGVVNVPLDALQHIRKRYAALVSMTDKWLGKMLDVMDKNDIWQDTMVIFTTDHGYMLGEHNFMAKNFMPAYNEVFHLPMMIHMPGQTKPGQRINGLTQNIDLFPTILDYFGIDQKSCGNPIRGKSLLALSKNEVEKVRDYALYGYFGKSINITDGKYTYFRAAKNRDNSPLYIYASMLSTLRHYYGNSNVRDISKIECGKLLKWTDFPVYRIPAQNLINGEKTQDFNDTRIYNKFIEDNMLFDIQSDYEQKMLITDEKLEKHMTELLCMALKEHDAPDEQFVRMGLDLFL